MAELRQIFHPGPPAAERVHTVRCHVTPRRVTLRAGMPLLDAMVAAVGQGVACWFDLSGVAASELAFVRPGRPPDDSHAAWYSATTMLQSAEISCAGAHLGRRAGAPFAHIHGVWADSDGAIYAGHLLADATILSRDSEVDVLILDGARMETTQDTETGFPLFRPVATVGVAPSNAILATAAPNQVIEAAIAGIAQTAGLENATIYGIGSLIGTEFTQGQGIDSFATEVLLTRASLSEDGVALAAVSIGIDGDHAEGELARSRNMICVTFELLLVGA